MNKPPKRTDGDQGDAPVMPFDDVLKRMLSSPPKQHKDERAKPKPAAKPAQKKPAK
jgi:hypothetical protein